MDFKALPQLAQSWYPDFVARWPVRFAVPNSPLVLMWLLHFLCLLDYETPQRFTVDASGRPLIAVKELAASLGMDPGVLTGLAVAWSLNLDERYVQHLRSGGAGEMEAWLNFAGLAIVIDSLQPEQVSEDQRDRLAQLKAILQSGLLKALETTSDDAARLNELLVSVPSTGQ